MLTIKTKIILAYTLVFGLMLLGFAYFIYEDTKEAETEKLDARLESYAAKISTELGEEENETREAQDQSIILKQEIDRRPGLHAQLITSNGIIIAQDSILTTIGISPRRTVAQWGERFEVFSTSGSRYRCLRIPIEINDHDQSILELAISISDLEENLHRLRLQFFIGIPLALVFTALAVYGITKMAFRPMIGMVETAGQITASNLHRRLTLPNAHDEVRHLGETLNSMIERIEAAFRSQKQFVADASHEIRTPLTVICSELEFAAKQTTEPPIKESIQTSLVEIDRLTKLTDGLLLLAKLDASQLRLDLQPVRLDELLIECVQIISTVARKKNIQIKIDVEDAVEIRADQDKMRRVFFNLLDNAVKYSGENTVVTASVSRSKSQPEKIQLRFEDQGPGIPPSALTHIFTRFYRADPARSENAGIGLGLAIVQQLVELHGGTVTVKSEVDKGTTFHIELPGVISSQ